MGFKFTLLCDLLSSLEDNRTLPASTSARAGNPDFRVIAQWFARHDKLIHDGQTNLLALLSSIFPEKRTERVYSLRETSLTRIIGRCLLLGSTRREELARSRVAGGGDLGQCIEKVMAQAENEIRDGQELTVEEIDAALRSIASRCRYSGASVRRQNSATDAESALGPLYRRLSSRDAKWLTRMILKTYSPVILPIDFILKKIHFLLPQFLRYQDSFEAALEMLSCEPICHFPAHPEPGLTKDLGAIALKHFKPRIGVKIGRPEYYKARSFKHCCQAIGRRRISLEKKYDGEYCQVHIDLTHETSIQIFSKSGKDSTKDRFGILPTIRRSLKIGTPECKFCSHCILEGELVVWSDRTQKILEFNKLRRHLPRSGEFIGADNDSPPQPDEHLMIVFFDMLLLDDDVCLMRSHGERRLLLKDVIQVIPGYATLAEQEVIDFSHQGSLARLERAMSRSIAERWEGLVLKGCDDPYFPILSEGSNGFLGRWIKFKKDYIPGLGDTIDLVLVGGRYEQRDAKFLADLNKLFWTQFYVGCLVNHKAVVTRAAAKPKFRIVDVIDRHCMSSEHMQFLNQFGEFRACRIDSNSFFDLEYGHKNLPPVEVVFKKPFVVECKGYGFEKPQNARYFTLRFPQILKIHSDRGFEDAVSFSELQLLADEARSPPLDERSETERWLKRLKSLNGSSRPIFDDSIRTERSLSPDADSFFLDELASHTRGSEDAENPHRDSCGLSAASIELVQNSSTTTCAAEKPNSIIIRTDESLTSPNKPDDSDIQVSFLSETGGRLSTNLNKKRTRPSESSSARKPYPEDQNCVRTQNACHSETHFAKDIPISSVQLDLTVGSVPKIKHTLARVAADTVRSYALGNLRVQSPLKTLPAYIVPGNLPNCLLGTETSSKIKQMNVAAALESFLDRLGSPETSEQVAQSNPHLASKGISVGLILIPQVTDSLGHEITRIRRTLVDKLRQSASGLATAGVLFLLDIEVLRLGAGPGDTRFCLHKTWENIGKSYFLGSVVWKRDAGDATALEPRCRNSERSPEIGVPRSAGKGPSISIRFSRRDLEMLGEFASVEPLAHVAWIAWDASHG